MNTANETKQTNAELERVKAYATFKPLVDEIKKEYISPETVANIAGYLGKGSNGYAISKEIENQKYAIKFKFHGDIEDDIIVLKKGKGIKNIARLVAYSQDDETVITKELPGTNLSKFNSFTKPNYSNKEITNLIQTIKEMFENGIEPDVCATNLMYDPKEGISILDYISTNKWSEMPTSIIGIIPALIFTTEKKTIDQFYDTRRNEFDKIHALNEVEEIILTSKVLNVMYDKFPEVFAETLKINERYKGNPQTSCYGTGFFDKTEFLESIDQYKELFSDQNTMANKASTAMDNIYSLGFF